MAAVVATLIQVADVGAQRRVAAGAVPRAASVAGPRRVWTERRVVGPTSDAWLGRDKVRHFGSSAAIQLLGYGSLRVMGASRGASVLVATLVTGAAGIGKEVQDSRRGGRASLRDLVWDGVGAVAGAGLARLGDPR